MSESFIPVSPVAMVATVSPQSKDNLLTSAITPTQSPGQLDQKSRMDTINKYNTGIEASVKEIIKRSKLIYVIIGNWPILFTILSYILYICGFFLEFSRIDPITGKRLILPFNKWLQFLGLNFLFILGITIFYCSIYNSHMIHLVNKYRPNTIFEQKIVTTPVNQKGGADPIYTRIEGADNMVPLSRVIDVMNNKNCDNLLNVLIGGILLVSSIYFMRSLYNYYTNASKYTTMMAKREIVLEVSKKPEDTRTPSQRLRNNK